MCQCAFKWYSCHAQTPLFHLRSKELAIDTVVMMGVCLYVLCVRRINLLSGKHNCLAACFQQPDGGTSYTDTYNAIYNHNVVVARAQFEKHLSTRVPWYVRMCREELLRVCMCNELHGITLPEQNGAPKFTS